jgi:phage gp29-like protein
MTNEELFQRNSAGRRALGYEVATRATDPLFYSTLEYLPNPDRVLRKLGRSQEVFEDIYGDAHVLGDLRSIRSALLSWKWRLRAGGDDPASVRALELADRVMAARPAPGMQWSDVIWAMGGAVFRGYAVHEVVWARNGNELVPVKVVDRPQRRFTFGSLDNELRLLTRAAPLSGEPVGERKWLVTRHMASFDNPYGVAVFSACFWPYIFKHSGVKYFTKFSEKFGIPWAIGKYPLGTPTETISALADSLAAMVEDAVAAIPNDSSVELLTASTGASTLPQERLVELCNREMSKALTSQTLASDLTSTGARAASETHRERETTVNESDRAIIEYSMNELLTWLAELNVANATPPRFEFYDEAETQKETVEALLGARGLVPLSKREVYARLQLSPPETADDEIPAQRTVSAPPPSSTGPAFSKCQHCGDAHDFAVSDDDPITKLVAAGAAMADDAIAAMPGPALDLLKEVEASGGGLEDFRARLPELWTAIDETRMGELTQLALMAGYLQGMSDP